MMMRNLDFILDCQVLKFSRKHLTLLPPFVAHRSTMLKNFQEFILVLMKLRINVPLISRSCLSVRNINFHCFAYYVRVAYCHGHSALPPNFMETISGKQCLNVSNILLEQKQQLSLTALKYLVTNLQI